MLSIKARAKSAQQAKRSSGFLAAGTGMRRGDVVGLLWSDVDLEARVLTVRGTLGRVGGELIITEPKTAKSRRSVPLSAPLVAMFRARRADQDAEREAAGDQWQENNLVFATEFGRPVDPRNVLRTVQIAAQKAGVFDIGVYTLRHSAAVAWLEGQVHIKALADLLGHSSIAVTGDIYGQPPTPRRGLRLMHWPINWASSTSDAGCYPRRFHVIGAAPDCSETASELLEHWSG
ncbi:hypothetical protein A5662_17105 [Mycobacteriaceae bacterium 1482268.1]|nr:hypothetical protein A5662_17105 [Mycobacteriaceae bacterium 1482268.1]